MTRFLILSSFLFLSFLWPFSVYAQRTDIDPPVSKKVMIIWFNPIIESQGNQRLNDIMGWHNPLSLEPQFIADMRSVSGNYVDYQIVERHDNIDDFPVFYDGYDYSDDGWFTCWNNRNTCHLSSRSNYNKILTDYQVCEKRNQNIIDELWIWGGPYVGNFYEAVMAGPGAFDTNGTPISNTTCQKQLHIFTFNPERSTSEMLEDMGHRVEGTMEHLFGQWKYPYGSPPRSLPSNLSQWDRFSARGFDVGITAGCGNIHGSLNTPTYDPNNYWAYDTNNQNVEVSLCEDWLNFPNLTQTTQSFNCSRWGCTKYGFELYWLSHIPKYTGNSNGKANNWWKYVLDYPNALASPTPIPSASIVPSPTPVPEDLNQDGAVNSTDLRIGITNFISGQVGCLNFADFNDDCKVTIYDVAWIIRRMN